MLNSSWQVLQRENRPCAAAVAAPDLAVMYTRLFGRGAANRRRPRYRTQMDAVRHGPSGDEIRRHLGRRYRPHPQRRAPRQARGRRRPRGRRRGLGHGGQDQRAGRLVPRGRAAARRARIRRRGRLRRAGHRPGCWRSRCRRWASTRAPGRAGRLPIATVERARLGAHPRHQRRRADQALQGAQARSRSIAGFQGIHKDTGRITTLGRGGSDTSRGRDRGGDPGRPLRHLHRRRRRLHHRPARGAAARGGSTRSPSRRCWKWPRSAPR